jgi:hypothetical protein
VSSGAVNILKGLPRNPVHHEVEMAVAVSGSGLLAFDKGLKIGHPFCHLTNKDETHPGRVQGLRMRADDSKNRMADGDLFIWNSKTLGSGLRKSCCLNYEA